VELIIPTINQLCVCVCVCVEALSTWRRPSAPGSPSAKYDALFSAEWIS